MRDRFYTQQDHPLAECWNIVWQLSSLRHTRTVVDEYSPCMHMCARIILVANRQTETKHAYKPSFMAIITLLSYASAATSVGFNKTYPRTITFYFTVGKLIHPTQRNMHSLSMHRPPQDRRKSNRRGHFDMYAGIGVRLGGEKRG